MDVIFKKRDESNCLEDIIVRNTGQKGKLDDFHKGHLHGLRESCAFLKDHKHTTVYIVGDYDADGVGASFILGDGLRRMGYQTVVLIPDRFSEGYGFSPKILEKMKTPGCIITVDNGITAHDTIEEAKKRGFDVFVTDHHLAPDSGILPECGILDPHVENRSTFVHYCGAGIAYRIIENMGGLPREQMSKYIIMASISTVADMVPLTGMNRYIVKAGLKEINKGHGTTGLNELIRQLQLETITETDYGFSIGPVINASGRMNPFGAYLPLNILSYDGDVTAELRRDVRELIDINKQRKALQKEQFSTVMLHRDEFRDDPVTVYYQNGLHEGLVGLIAANVREETGKPAIILTDASDENYVKGSGRSTDEIHMKELLDRHKELLAGYGGHQGAAGVTLPKANLASFRKAVAKDAVVLNAETGDENVVYYDLEIRPEDIVNNVNALEAYKPFGMGNPSPVYKVGPVSADVIGSRLYRVMGAEKEHIKITSKGIDYLMFGLGKDFKAEDFPKNMEFVGTLSKRYYHGVWSYQMEVEAFREIELHQKSEVYMEMASLFDFC